ncbi:MAG: choice-of-anchor D domain-containing protein [Candidatus Marinimicrobia bacterium]|nr:choice-of-anchor D domain-containing protein [Candidatus Neomarinimicrobiota bacterium]
MSKKIGLAGLFILVVGCSDMGEPEIFLPQLLVNTNAIDFSIISLGTNHSQEFLIINAGEGELTGNLILVQDSTTFTILPSGAFTVAADDTLIAEISFDPSSESAFSASVVLSSNDPTDSELIILVNGVGSSAPIPVLSVSTGSLDFGLIPSDASSQQPVTLSNTGTDTLVITSIVSDLAVFTLNTSLPIILAPGESQVITLTFLPGGGGVFNATLSIHSNSASTPNTISLVGTGESPVSYSSAIQPIWNESCTGCHGSSGGLSLTSYSQLMAGNSNNGPVVISGNGSGSRLVQKLKGTAGSRMPFGGAALPAATIDLVETWIDQGALNN